MQKRAQRLIKRPLRCRLVYKLMDSSKKTKCFLAGTDVMPHPVHRPAGV